MPRLSTSATLLAALLLGSPARAQVSPNDITIASFDPENAVAPVSTVEGPGIKVGEGTVLYPAFGLETGVVSNVFYEDTGIRNAGLLRLLAQIGTGSMSNLRLEPASDGDGGRAQPSFEYRAALRASYDFVLSSDNTVSDTGGLGLGLTLRGAANPAGPWTFGFENDFVRLIRAANFETDANTNRDINELGLKLLYHPPGRSLAGYLYYNNTIDIFERSEQSFADRFQNRFGIHPMWRWLPQTQVYADVSWGIYTGLGSSSMKVTSYPLTTVAGIGTLITTKTTLNFQAGYTNGFYSSGPSYSALTLGAAAGYRYSPLGRVALTYDLRYDDSVNANYYRDHIVRLWVQQLFAPFVLMVQPEIHFREYNGITIVSGPPVRNDIIVAVVGGINYNFRNWLAATLNYRFSTVQTDYLYMTDGVNEDPSFVRHELLLGARMAL